MIFIDKSVFTIDFKSGAAMRQTNYYINDSFSNQLPKANVYKYNGIYNISFVDPTFIFNSRYNSNFERVTKTYTFRCSYKSGATTTGLYQFYGRYKFANIESGESVYSFNAQYNMAASVDGIIEFNAPYRYVISDTVFEFSAKYISENYISTPLDVDALIGVNPVDKIISFEAYVPLHRTGLINYDEIVNAIKDGLIDDYTSEFDVNEICQLLSFSDIAKYLRSVKKTLALILNNGSKYQNVFVPLLLDIGGNIRVEGIYRTYLDVAAINTTFKSAEFATSENFTTDVTVPSMALIARNIDPNRPVSFKYAIIDLNDTDLVGS